MGAPKQKWTAEEEEALEAGVNKYGTGKWKKILKDPEFGHSFAARSNIDLKDKWRNMHCRKVEAASLEATSTPKNMGKRPWTATEDRILLDYIETHGEGDWSNLPTKAGIKRCGKACCNRWFNYLRSDIKGGNISSVEQELIIRLHKLFGNRWSLIARILSGRTANEIQNYWETNLANKIQDHSTSSSTRKSFIKSKDKKRTVTGTSVETRTQSQIVESRDKNSGSTDRCKEMDLESGCPLRGRNLQNNEMDCNHGENCFLSEFPPLWNFNGEKTDDFLSPNSDDPSLYLDEMLQNWTGDDGLSDIDIDTLINALGSEEDWLEE